MTPRLLPLLTACWLASVGHCLRAQEPIENLNSLLKPIQEKNRLPALAAAIVSSKGTLAIGAIGVRKLGSSESVTPQDRWHIGSCAKAMTAAVLARLVEQGKLRWNTTLVEIFPDRLKKIRADYQEVTLEQLLCHRAGLPSDMTRDPAVWLKVRFHKGSGSDQRTFLVDALLRKPPEIDPGSGYLYSNAGYVIAGAIAESVTAKSWERFIQKELFEPLGMSTAGFGPPGKKGLLDEPRGHQRTSGGFAGVEPDLLADNPPGLAPAGTLHCSLEDWGKFVSGHLSAAQGKSDLLSPDAWRKLQNPAEGQEYGFGWIFVDRAWAGGIAMNHAGSNGLWYAAVWAAPKRDWAALVVTNQGGDQAAQACDETASVLVQHFLGQ